MNDSAGRVSSMVSLVLRRSGIFFLLAFALLAQSAWGQRIGPLVLDNQQRSKASSAERAAAAVRTPSLQLSLPPPATAALPPLGPDDLQRLQPQESLPPVIGVHRRLPPGTVTLSFSGGAVKTTAEGAWQSTAVGRLWRLKMTSPGARAMRIHFRDFAIGAGSLWLHSASGQVVGPYTGSGLYGDGDFWSGIVFGRQPDDRVSARWGVGGGSRAVPNRGHQPYLGRCFWRRRGGRRPMAGGRVGELRQAGSGKAATRPDRRCGGNAVEEVAADKGNTVGRAVRLPATADPESGKAAHVRDSLPTSVWGRLTPRRSSPGITRSGWRFPATPPA